MSTVDISTGTDSHHNGAATPSIAFIGRSGSGKTVLTEQIIAELTSRGYKVGTIKHHGHRGFDIDVPGKDSWRHTQAGSVHTVIVSPDKIASYRSLDHEIEFTDVLSEMDDVDIVVVEGFRHCGSPSIELLRSGSQKDTAVASDPEKLSEVLSASDTLATVTDIDVVRAEAAKRNLKVFAFDGISQICDFIESRILGR